MDLPILRMNPSEARLSFLEYRGAVREAIDAEFTTTDPKRRDAIRAQRLADEAIMEGYRQLGYGRTVINLHDAIQKAGEDKEHRPRLAVARADRQTVRMVRHTNGSVTFGADNQRKDHEDPRTARFLSFPARTMPALATLGAWGRTEANATVPLIPPRFRPALNQLHRYHLLWEADWHAVPVDPALLRALGSGLYQVLATWDLTELERAVLGARAN